MKPVEIDAHCRNIVGALSQIIVGKDDVLHQLLAGILANGHILIEDYPGLAKTLIARLLSETLDLDFKRIQFTPDLLPGDITGGFLYDQREARFEFRRGPIFTQLLLADEINRATPKTQSALLEAMEEGQVTVEGAPTRWACCFWSSPRKTRSISKAPTRCPRRSSTDSSCGLRSATPAARRRERSCRDAAGGAWTRRMCQR